MKKLIPAIVMLLVSAVVLSTASYAWFTTSTNVSADGMQVTATAPSSILISGKSDDANWTAYSNILNFADIYDGVKLTPVSSADGQNFYVPKAAYDVSGAMDYMTEIAAISAEATDTYYVDFQVDLKNDSANEAVDIGIKSIENLIENSAMANAIRVAIIVGTPRDLTAEQTDSRVNTITDPTSVTVYTIDDYVEKWVGIADKEEDNLIYQTGVNGAQGPIEGDSAEATTYELWKVVAAGDTDWAPDAKNVALINDLAPQNAVQVTIRVWFEGQDASCISANAGANAKLTVQFGIITPAPAEPDNGEG